MTTTTSETNRVPRDPLENLTRVEFVLELPRLGCRVPG